MDGTLSLIIGAVVVVGVIMILKSRNPLRHNAPKSAVDFIPIYINPDLHALVLTMVTQGKRKDALNQVRWAMRLTQQEAEQYLDWMERGMPGMPGGFPGAQATAQATGLIVGKLAHEVQALLVNDDTIAAVNLIRERTGWDLNQAQAWVDALKRRGSFR